MGYWVGSTWHPDDADPIAASMSRDALQTISDSTITLVQLWTNDFSSGNLFKPTVDAATNYRITINKAGYYRITYGGSYTTTGPNFSAKSYLYKNGSELHYTEHHMDSTGTYPIFGSRIVALVAGDYLDLRTWQDSGGPQPFVMSQLDVHLLR